jgi:hypothetical protein
MKKLIVVLLLCLFPALLIACPPNLWAAITFDAQAEGDGVDTDTVTYAHTVGGGCTNLIIVVDITGRRDGSLTINTMTIGGSSATSIDSQAVAGFSLGVDLYRRVGVSTSSNTITVVFAAANDRWHVSSRSYCGVNQTTPTGTAAKAADTSQTSSAPSVDVLSASGELVIDEMTIRDSDSWPTCSVGASQTQRDNTAVGFFHISGSSEEAGAGTITMDWSCDVADAWGIVGVPLKPATPARRSIVIIVE